MDDGLIVLLFYILGGLVWCMWCGVESKEEEMGWGLLWPMMPPVLLVVGCAYCFYWLGGKIGGHYDRHTKCNK